MLKFDATFAQADAYRVAVLILLIGFTLFLLTA
jgi:hypothetical protein